MKHRLRKKKKGLKFFQFFKGFTLIEIVISLLILVVGVVGVITLLSVGLKVSKRAMDITQATLFAEAKMEELKLNGYDSLESDTGTCSNPNFSWQVVVGSEINPPGNLKQVAVTISWTEGNQNYAETFTTLITKY